MAAEWGERVWGGVHLALRTLDMPMAGQRNPQVRRSQRVVGTAVASLVQIGDTFYLLSLPTSFPFPSPSHSSLSFERATGSFSCSTCGQADPHSPSSPSTSSARKVVLACCQTAAAFSALTASAAASPPSLCHLLHGPVHPLLHR